jgi:hypothetical protein
VSEAPRLGVENRELTYPITRGEVGKTLAEPPSFINVREVRDWCKECREYRPQMLSATNLFAVSLGALVGFLPALAATNSKTNGGWWGIFFLGSVVAAVGCLVALLAMVMEMPSVRKRLGLSERPSMHQRLADRMDGACQAGLLRASAAEEALQREEKRQEEESRLATETE